MMGKAMDMIGMIEASPGWMLIGTSLLGVIGCVIALLASKKIFAKQRKRLLDQIEAE